MKFNWKLITSSNDDSHQADNIVLTKGLEDETTKSFPMVQRVAASVNSMIWTSVDVEAEVEIGFSLHFYFLENIIDKLTTSWYR